MKRPFQPLPRLTADLSDYDKFRPVSSKIKFADAEYVDTFAEVEKDCEGYLVALLPTGMSHLIRLSDLEIIYIFKGHEDGAIDVCPFEREKGRESGLIILDGSDPDQEEPYELWRYTADAIEVEFLTRSPDTFILVYGSDYYIDEYDDDMLIGLADNKPKLDLAGNYVRNVQPGIRPNEWIVQNKYQQVFDSDTCTYFAQLGRPVEYDSIKPCGDAYTGDGNTLLIPFSAPTGKRLIGYPFVGQVTGCQIMSFSGGWRETVEAIVTTHHEDCDRTDTYQFMLAAGEKNLLEAQQA